MSNLCHDKKAYTVVKCEKQEKGQLTNRNNLNVHNLPQFSPYFRSHLQADGRQDTLYQEALF